MSRIRPKSYGVIRLASQLPRIRELAEEILALLEEIKKNTAWNVLLVGLFVDLAKKQR